MSTRPDPTYPHLHGDRVACGSLRAGDAGRDALVQGWVARRRDHGGLIFIDVRDRWGMVQVVFNPAEAVDAHRAAGELRAEFVVQVEGLVRPRPAGSENADLETGAIEILARRLTVINRSETPPFPIEDEEEAEERLRMRYRYLDLRRPRMQRNFAMRHSMTSAMRRHLDALGFMEVETPILFKSTPEGARDYLVPSRVHPGEFYALVQSPQILKQLLMVSSYERYYQVARCFRDEDLRSDRQPEFTQLDAELSFTPEEGVLEVVEGLFADVWRQCLGVELARPFPRMTFAEAMRRFGSDKPDTRFGMELSDLNPALQGTAFNVFGSVIDQGGQVVAIAVPGQAQMPRRQIDALGERARGLGARGLAWLANGEGAASPLDRNLTDSEKAAMHAAAGSAPGDLLLIVAGSSSLPRTVLGALRLDLGAQLGLVPEGRWDFLFVTEMPLFEGVTDEGHLISGHHPFTRPRDEDLPLLDSDPLAVRAYAYDAVLNGWELMSGSIRIHDPALQSRIFEMIGFEPEQIHERFGFLIDAFRFGVPPHGGFAIGLDRVAALLAGERSIREVIAFPKTQQAQDLMSGAPSPVDGHQLDELHISVRPRPPAVKPA
ncbi:MAG: aspartate--tRNA ligase [Candidatus Dormibacteria bacterium]